MDKSASNTRPRQFVNRQFHTAVMLDEPRLCGQDRHGQTLRIFGVRCDQRLQHGRQHGIDTEPVIELLRQIPFDGENMAMRDERIAWQERIGKAVLLHR